MLHIGDNGEYCLVKLSTNRIVWANLLSDTERSNCTSVFVETAGDIQVHLCLITQANFNAYHHSTPTEKAALRSCPNTKVIADLATGRDSPQQ